MIEQLLHVDGIGAASHRLLFNLFNLFWLLLSMTFNVIAKTQCSCHLVLPTHGWHISVSIVLVSHSLFKTRLHASMARFSKKNKPIQQIDQWKHSSTTRIYQDTCTLTQGRMAYSTSCSAASREAWHLGQHHLSIKILCFWGEAKNQPFLKGCSYWYPCIFKDKFSFSVSLGHDNTSTPKILASPGSSWPLCCLWPSMELPQAWTTLGTRSEKTSTVWYAGWTRWLLIIAIFNICYIHCTHQAAHFGGLSSNLSIVKHTKSAPAAAATPPPQPPVAVPATATAPPLSWNQQL